MRTPPRLLRRLLVWVLPQGGAREGLVGDLDELYAKRSQVGGRKADIWYAVQVAGAATYYLPRRVKTSLGALLGGLGPSGFAADSAVAFRTLSKRPGFATVVVVTLGLGIGANTAVLSVVRSVVLRPLPYPEPDRLAVLLLDMEVAGYPEGPPSIPEYVALRDQLRSWDQLAAHRTVDLTLTGGIGHAERVSVAVVSTNFFATLEVAPLIGRAFRPDEGQDGPDAVAILSHGLWQTRYGGDRGVIGTSISVEGRPRTIVGVMPQGFGFPSPDVQLWVPLAMTPEALAARGVHAYSVVGRLQPGTTLVDAQEELGATMERIVSDSSLRIHDWHPPFLRPLDEEVVGDAASALWMVMAAAGLVLAIACLNVASLMLVRAELRTRELWVRVALGAGRRRVLSHLLAESTVLATAGALLGLGLAHLGLETLRAVAPPELPRLDELDVDGVVLGVTALVSLGAALAFAVLPALVRGRSARHGALSEVGRSTTAGATSVGVRQTLVVSQTALAVVLLIAAGLLLQSSRRLSAVDPGFNVQQVLTAGLDVPRERYGTPAEAAALYEAVLDRVRALPGVVAAGAIRRAPLSVPIGPSSIEVEGWVRPADVGAPVAVVQVATPGYFESLGIPIDEGRGFEPRDRAGQLPVAIVSEALARTYWPGRSALGARLRVNDPDQPFAEIVGIVSDIRQNRLDRPPSHGTLFLPHAQAPALAMSLSVRSSAEAGSLASSIRTEIAALDPSIPVHDVRTMQQALSTETATERFTALLQSLFAALALALSAVGLYGVLASTVTRRTTEIGIRIALGAERARVGHLVVRQGLSLVAIAVLIGLAGGFVVGQVLESFLFGTSATEPLTYVVVTAALLSVGFVACWAPAWRAVSVDPVVALRADP